MNKNEITLAIVADFSKAFDTIKFDVIIRKLHKVGFSKQSLLWIFSYLCDRQQYIQIDDRKSSMLTVSFGVPQGSVLGPILFNLYVSDMQDHVTAETILQYADDTTFYHHGKILNIADCLVKTQNVLSSLQNWSSANNLLFNEIKTKAILFSGSRLSKLNNHDDLDLQS